MGREIERGREGERERAARASLGREREKEREREQHVLRETEGEFCAGWSLTITWKCF
jgi:hypothetical protein